MTRNHRDEGDRRLQKTKNSKIMLRFVTAQADVMG